MVLHIMSEDDDKWIYKKIFEMDSKINVLGEKLMLNIDAIEEKLSKLDEKIEKLNEREAKPKKSKIQLTVQDKMIFWLVIIILTMAGVFKDSKINVEPATILKSLK